MIKEETKKILADGLEAFVGEIGFAFGILGSGSIAIGTNYKSYVQRKIESFYQRHEIPYTPRSYLSKK